MQNPCIGRLGQKSEPAGKTRVFAKVDSIRQGIFGPMHEWLAGRLLPTYLLMLRPNGSRAAGTTHSWLGPVRPTLSQFERVSNPNRCESDLYSSLHSGTAVSPPLPPGQRCSTAKKKVGARKKGKNSYYNLRPFIVLERCMLLDKKNEFCYGNN